MIQLTTSQQTAIDSILHEMDNPSKGGVISLVGGGGVGKTTSIFSLIGHLENEQRKNVLICAPAHQACNVLRDTQVQFDNSTPVSTLASALGFKQLPVDGKRAFKVAGGGKLEGVDVVIVDEASQVGSTAFRELQTQALKNNITIIGLGDDCQLPPVKEFSSPMFNNGRLFELTEVIRYTGDVLKVATDLRTHIKSGAKASYDLRQHIPTGSTDITAYGSREDFLAAAVSAVDYEDPTKTRIIAWRNSQVLEYNRHVHEALHGANAPEYLVGDIVLPQNPVVRKNELLSSTDNPCRVISFRPAKYDMLDLGKVLLDVYVMGVVCLRTSNEFEIVTVAQHHQSLYEQAIAEIATMCRAGEVHWSEFYALEDELTPIRHPYASTAHKAQGGTFQYNFMDVPDIMRCRQQYIRDRLLYTALTRSNTLGILK